MKKRIVLSHEDIEKALRKQLKMLHKSCEEFDKSNLLLDIEETTLQIALRLRILWHNTKRSKGLVAQLNLVSEVVDTAFVVPPTFVYGDLPAPALDERRLFAIGSIKPYAPLFDHGPAGISISPFKQWWEGTVISDGEGHKFTRKDLVLAVSNTDGGAHVDSSLDAAYYSLTRKGTFGIIRVVPTKDPNVFRKVETPSPVAVTLRQIGHETLKSLCSGYNYNGSFYYPGGSICWMSAHITPSTD